MKHLNSMTAAPQLAQSSLEVKAEFFVDFAAVFAELSVTLAADFIGMSQRRVCRFARRAAGLPIGSWR